MKLIAQLQLKPTPSQKEALRATLERANLACDFISQVAFENQVFGQFELHHLVYEEAKARFSLSAQMVVRCISKVVDAYKLDQKTQRSFKSRGAISYDDRILTYSLEEEWVNIWVLGGRIRVPFVCGEVQKQLLQTRQGESDLCLVKGKWFLMATCNVEEPPLGRDGEVLGVDFGIAEIATTSEGKSYSGEKVKALRRKMRAHRARLQKRGTTSAKRRLKKAAKKQERFVRDTNHCISKELVATAKASQKALGLEDLTGIRDRANGFNKEMRWQMGNWAFGQLRAFVEYKAQKAGVRVVVIDPRNTSRTCHECGHCEKANRKSQAHFKCRACGHQSNADYNAALNISKRAAVNPPIVSALRS